MNMKQYMKENAIVIHSKNETENLNEVFGIFNKSRTIEKYLKKIQNVEVKNDIDLKKKNELVALLKPFIFEFRNAEDSGDEEELAKLKIKYREVLKKISMNNFLKKLPITIGVTTIVIMIILFSILLNDYMFISKLIKDGKFDIGNNSVSNIFTWVDKRNEISKKGNVVGNTGIIAAIITTAISVLNGKKLKKEDEEIKQELITALKKNK